MNQTVSLDGRVNLLTTLLFFVALVAGFATFGSTTALNDVAHHFGHLTSGTSIQSVVGISGSVLGLGLSILRVASLAALPLAALADRWGRTSILERTLLLGLALTAVAALSPSYWFFVACFALARPLLAAATTMVQVITVELSTTAARIRLLAIMAAGDAIGSGLSAVLHGVIRGPDSFRWLFALAAVPIFAVVPWLRSIPEPRARAEDVPMARLGAVPHEALARLWIVIATAFLIGVVTGPAGGFTFVYSESILKMKPFDVAVVVAVSGLVGLFGLFLGSRLAGSVGRRATVAIGVTLTAVVSTYAYSGGKPAFVVGYLLSVGAGGVLSPAMTAISTEIFSHRYRATAAGWIVVGGVVGAVAGLALFGFIGDVAPATAAGGLRLAAIVTFLPFLPILTFLRRLPESRGVDLT